MRDELPHPGKIIEEPLRPLLAVVACAAHALQLALDAEYPDPLPDRPGPDDGPPDPSRWIAEVLAAQLQSLRAAIGLYEVALRHRNARSSWRARANPPDF